MMDETRAVGGDPARGTFSPRREVLGGALLVALTLIAYQAILTDRAGSFEFLNVDDQRYVVENPHVTGGLTREDIWWALTSLHQSNWHPLTWLSLQLDAQLHGLHPWGFHLTNLFLHVANAVLLFAFLYRTTGGWGRSLTVAALFAVHPLHVESVAWVAERKDVLSTFFCLLAMLAYAAHAARPSWLRYALVMALLALGLMAKSMLVTLPCLLLLLDAWPLARFRVAALSPAPARTAELVAEKLPLVTLALAGAAITLRAQSRMMDAMSALPLSARVENAAVYYVTYVGRMLWPASLVVYHPNPGAALGWLPVLGAILALAAVTIFAVRTWPQRPYLLVGWLWYLGSLVPVIGLVQVGFLVTTDHYTYVPLIGLFIMLVWGGHDLCEGLRGSPGIRAAPVLLAGVPLGLCVVLTRHQIEYWRDSVSLWEHVVEVGPERAFPHSFLARALEAKGRNDEAERHYARASQLDATWEQHREKGLALERQDDLWGSRRELETALLSAPHDVTTLEHLAAQFQRRGEIGDALRHYTTLARLQPRDAGPENNLGLLYEQRGDVVKARAHWLRALALDPALAEARAGLARLPPGDPPDSSETGGR